MNFGYRTHSRARVARRGFLVDRNRGTQSFDTLNVRFLHLSEEKPRVRRKRFDVTPLSFGEDRVERERRFAAARKSGKHYEFVAREFEVYVFEVVFLCSADYNLIHCFASCD